MYFYYYYCSSVCANTGVHANVVRNYNTARRGALGFLVLRFWLFFRLVFQFLSQKTLVFRFLVYCGCGFLVFFSICFSVFVKNPSRFSVLVPDVVFGFSCFVLFWDPVSLWFDLDGVMGKNFQRKNTCRWKVKREVRHAEAKRYLKIQRLKTSPRHSQILW